MKRLLICLLVLLLIPCALAEETEPPFMQAFRREQPTLAQAQAALDLCLPENAALTLPEGYETVLWEYILADKICDALPDTPPEAAFSLVLVGGTETELLTILVVGQSGQETPLGPADWSAELIRLDDARSLESLTLYRLTDIQSDGCQSGPMPSEWAETMASSDLAAWFPDASIVDGWVIEEDTPSSATLWMVDAEEEMAYGYRRAGE